VRRVGKAVAPPFPRNPLELDSWSVHADLLLERGDRLGHHLAWELTLPAEPTGEQLTAFHKSAQRVCRVPPAFSASWMLGHVHSLALTPELSRPMPQVDADTLPVLAELLRTPALSRLEQLSFAANRSSVGRRWHDAMAQLPPTCRRFELHANRYTARDAARVLEAIPPQVEVLRLVPKYGTEPALLISDQFEWVDLRSLLITPHLVQSLATALASTRRVKLRLGTLTDRSLLQGLERVVVGGPDDAALIAEDPKGPISLFERMGLEGLQQRHGLVPVRVQLTRSLKESWRLGRTLDPATAWAGDGVIVRSEGRWWARAVGEQVESPWLQLEGEPLGQTPVPLAEGARFEIGRRPMRFTERCP